MDDDIRLAAREVDVPDNEFKIPVLSRPVFEEMELAIVPLGSGTVPELPEAIEIILPGIVEPRLDIEMLDVEKTLLPLARRVEAVLMETEKVDAGDDTPEP